MIIKLPLPPKELSPNARVHWAKKAKAVKYARAYAYSWAVGQILARYIPPPQWDKATIQYTFYWPTKHKHDDDNAIASCKAYRDGLADAGIVTDDVAFTTLPVIMRIDKENPRVEIEVLNGS